MGWEQEAFVRSLSSLSTNTVDAYRRDVRDFVVWADRARVGGPADVDHLVLRRYLAFLTTRRLAKRSIARKAAALRRYFGWLTRTGVLATDPSRRLTAPRGEGRLPHVLKHDELETLFAEGTDTGPVGLRDRAVIELLYGSGLRVGELCGLRPGDVDLVRGQLLVWGKGGLLLDPWVIRRRSAVPVGAMVPES
ncbi:MAG: site-specific integrase [Acidimicrobiales bacterium]